jgi:hypothetical protein
MSRNAYTTPSSNATPEIETQPSCSVTLERPRLGPRRDACPAGSSSSRRADDVLARDPRDRLRRVVPEPDDAVRVDEEDAVADGLEHARRLAPLLDLAVELRVLDGVPRGARAPRRARGRPAVAPAGLRGDERDDAEQLAVRDAAARTCSSDTELAHEAEVEVVACELRELLLADLRARARSCRAQHERRALRGVGFSGYRRASSKRQLDLLRIDVLDRERAQRPVLDHVDTRPVGDARHRSLRRARAWRGSRATRPAPRLRRRGSAAPSSARFWSWMSMFEPNHFTTAPLRSVIGTPRQVPAIRVVGRHA